MGKRVEDKEGHRERLRDRFRRGGERALADYELLELLLTYAVRQKDMKPLAKELLNHFGSLARMLDQPGEALERVSGLGPAGSTLLMLVRACVGRYLEEAEPLGPVLSTPEAVVGHLAAVMGGLPREQFLLLCLDGANRMVHREALSLGTINQAAVYPREVVKAALLHDATAVVVVHNHPSGCLAASEEDLKVTRLVERALQAAGIALHDHLIVTRQGAFSIKGGRVILP